MTAGRLGMWCQRMLDETDKQGRRKYSLAALLDDRKTGHVVGRYRTDFDRIPLEAA